jgi:hypothetical protein
MHLRGIVVTFVAKRFSMLDFLGGTVFQPVQTRLVIAEDAKESKTLVQAPPIL